MSMDKIVAFKTILNCSEPAMPPILSVVLFETIQLAINPPYHSLTRTRSSDAGKGRPQLPVLDCQQCKKGRP
jgi:hypothetical protein